MTTFEHTGFWWDASEPGTRWPGTLRFDPVSGAVLTRVIPNDLRLLFGIGFGRGSTGLTTPSQWAAITAIASKLGCTGETLRKLGAAGRNATRASAAAWPATAASAWARAPDHA